MPEAAEIVAATLCLLVFAECARFAYSLSHMRSLAVSRTSDPGEWPLVSVVVAGRNEAESAGTAIASHLADDYPLFEIVFVDDRSYDHTSEAVLAAADGDSRVSVLRIDELPEGWLGKVHALARGTELARGDWLLFTDADVRVEPGSLRRAVAYAIEHKIDLLALVPEYRTGSLAVDAVWAAFMRVLAMTMDPAKIRDPHSSAAIGSGAFNLVRRTALERTPGFEHIRLETGDDAALGQMVKQAGGSLEMIDGHGCASVAVYRSVRELVRGVEKNGSTMADRPYALVVVGFVAWVAIEVAPLVLLISYAQGAVTPWLGTLAAATVIVNTASYAAALWTNTRTWIAGLMWPFGLAVLAFAVARSVHLAHKQGGVYWRETFYTLDELNEGRRYKI